MDIQLFALHEKQLFNGGGMMNRLPPSKHFKIAENYDRKIMIGKLRPYLSVLCLRVYQGLNHELNNLGAIWENE